MARMTGGEAIVKALAREGVKVAFGLPGVQLYGIVTAFRDEPMRFITVRHEGSTWPTATRAPAAASASRWPCPAPVC